MRWTSNGPFIGDFRSQMSFIRPLHFCNNLLFHTFPKPYSPRNLMCWNRCPRLADPTPCIFLINRLGSLIAPCFTSGFISRLRISSPELCTPGLCYPLAIGPPPKLKVSTDSLKPGVLICLGMKPRCIN